MKNRLNEYKKILIFAVAVILLVTVLVFPVPDSIRVIGDAELTDTGQAVLAVLIFALVLWMTEAIPFHITGLISIAVLTLLKVETFKFIVKEGFGNDIIIFFIGVLILSAFINKSGLGKRISILILSVTGNKTKFIILGFLLVGALLSMWITNMAVAAMLLPLGVSILEKEGLKPLKSNFGKALMIACAWGPIIGGIATPAGAGTNPLTIGFLKELAGIEVNFLQWMVYGVPTALLLIIPAWGVLLLMFRPEIKQLSIDREQLIQDRTNLDKISREELVTIVVFLLTIVLWVGSPLLEKLLNINIPISMPILITSCLFFLPNVSRTKWKQIEQDVSWSGILLVVTGISLGMMIYYSGAALWLSTVLLGGFTGLGTIVRIFAFVLVVAILKVAFSSNTVTATIIIPIIIVLAQTNGIETLSIVIPVGITSSLSLILVTSSPTNVIPYAAGYFSISDMAKAGIVLTIITSIIITGSVYGIGLIMGLY